MGKIRKSPASPKPLPRSLKIHISNHQKDLPLGKLLVRKAIRELLSHLKVVCDEVSVCFVSEKKICELHNRFFSDPSPTDCITFPMDDSHLGEIFICPATAISYVEKRGIDPYHETLLYLIHGILHLIGYGDLDPADRKAMRKMERRCMNHLIKRGICLGSVST